ncbi:Uncharacterised protein [Edwardsiella tarda]|nr:Uncharacterised protein [Edwardsiella tarda]
MVAYLESYCDSALYNHLYIDNKLSGINIWKQNEILRASERVGEMAIVGTREVHQGEDGVIPAKQTKRPSWRMAI